MAEQTMQQSVCASERRSMLCPKETSARSVWGFTLIEVMIVVSMIVIFTAVGLGYSQDAGGQISFFRDQSKFVSEIYRVRAMAIAT